MSMTKRSILSTKAVSPVSYTHLDVYKRQTHYTTGAGNIKRFNMFNSATISGEAAHGYSSGPVSYTHLSVLRPVARIASGSSAAGEGEYPDYFLV